MICIGSVLVLKEPWWTHNTIKLHNKRHVQIECLNNNIFGSIEQSIVNVKDELNVAINEKLNHVTEQVVITKDMNSDIWFGIV